MNPLLPEFLSEVERAEAVLLAWGVVDGWTAEEELYRRAESLLERYDGADGRDDFDDGYALIEEGVRLRILFRWHEGGAYRYRSRLAETMRLLARARQLFPRHLQTPGGWAQGPTLVSDFRLLLRAREYPNRNHPRAEAVARWSGDPDARLTPLQTAALHALLDTAQPDRSGLAGFQVRATTRLLQTAGAPTAAGTVICAGTGSGKTLAFYLPALTRLVGGIEQDASAWTRVLAIYPRNELLKDQFTETCRQARRVRAVLQGAGLRPLTVGAYFGPTPAGADQVERNAWGEPWQARAGGRVCPFLVCPGENCTGAMLWRDVDRRGGVERLVCERCSTTVESDEIVLTRRRMRRQPPDILFTTTIMMNQRLTDSRSWHLFGAGQPTARRPEMVLLDEAHTYGGTQGAQVAYLLRRWRHRTQATPHFVGLSATLMEASTFFAQLTGLPPASVEKIEPRDGELVQEGMEYMIALRGDPVSGSNLLSATIQSAMLLRRTLDPRRGDPSEGTFGRKVFVFTDDLDVTNRLYFNLLDAEGQDPYGRPDPRRHPGGSLANLRATRLPDEALRFAAGQSWRLCEEIGHSLTAQTHIPIDRVSSQDSGVNLGAEIIVATASLEVGFNDPEVGAILQHKAPCDPASFLQRKGRAGRDRRMRPLTVVLLSDFARDQLAFQGYDLLFDPELRPRELPLANRHVLKMQAAYACLDCLAYHLPAQPGGHLWVNASRPAADEDENFRADARTRQQHAASWLEGVLGGRDEYDRLQEWLRRSLRLGSEDDLRALLWEPPRALMTAVLPTLHRRLSTQWLHGNAPGGERHGFYHPLPEFIPATFYDELNLPEVTIYAAQTRGESADREGVFGMPVARALREFAPGRISRRFGIRHALSRHWLPLDAAGPARQTVEVGTFCGPAEREELGEFFFRDAGAARRVRVLRPWTLRTRTDAPRDQIKDSSNAFPIWHSQLLPFRQPDAGVAVDLPAVSPWSGVLEEIRFFTHRQFQPARIRRFSLGSHATLNLTGGDTHEVTAGFVLAGGDGADSEPEPVALGFALEADALRVRLRLPQDWRLGGGSRFAGKTPALRNARFHQRVLDEPSFDGLYNVFQRNWLAEICLAAITATAVAAQVPLGEAWTHVRASQEGALPLAQVLEVIFQTAPVEGEDNDTKVEQHRLAELRDALTDPPTLATLDGLITMLWEPPGPDWTPWLRGRFLATVGAALREGIQQMCPEVDVQSLVVDIDPGLDEAGDEQAAGDTALIWISEDTPGGGGVVERLLPRLTAEPRRLLGLMLGALGESDFEIADRELRRFLDTLLSNEDPALAASVRAFRQAGTLEAITGAFRALQTELRRRGFQVSHAVLTALSARLLKAGSSAQTDALVGGMIARWQEEEARLGIEIEARAFASALSVSDTLDQTLGIGVPLPQGRRAWRFNALLALLWPRGTQARNHTLSLRSPYAAIPAAERLLVLDALESAGRRVEFGAPDWQRDCDETLIAQGSVFLAATPDRFPGFRAALVGMLVNPLDTGSLLLHPRLRGLTRDGLWLVAHLELVTPGRIDVAGGVEEAAASTARLIVKTAHSGQDEIRDLLESLLAVELLAPGDELWLVSPWITDLPLLDNRTGGYAGLEASWPKRYITLPELLAFALKANDRARLHIVTRPDSHTNRFCERLLNLVTLDGNDGRLSIDRDRASLHTKGLVSTGFLLNGSMNFTLNGIEVLDEAVQLETDPERVAQFRLSLHGHYA